jgi:hypothetical protein
MDPVYEKLGKFYLGKVQHAQVGTSTDYLLYDAKDLTTHALCVGMTGSGKTGLCISLLEEAGIDGIPAIVVDPKGDLGNLLLTFPQLRAEDFRPWVDESEAARQSSTADEFAAATAEKWRQGLSEWEQDGDRINRFRSAVDLTIYTPGSSTGLPLTVLRSFAAPPEKLFADVDAFRDRVAASTAGLLALLGLDIDPVQSREFILVSNLLENAWREKRDLDIANLIREIQEPPLTEIGVLDLETFYPAKERMKLAMSLNSLLASPSFASWLEGDPLDIERLLYTEAGKPRISILSVAHLSDAERMFFVTILLNELLTWVRTQPGTPSLRALFYMDEVFGYFPPTANPPSKQPMLTLLKQARAYGLGLVLATQNPVDLDYKGLSNCGTWFLGRLQTERDKARVLDGLESASSTSSSRFDRKAIDKVLSDLDSRVFVMNNVHDDDPAIFRTRWAMSYLRGPLTRDQIRRLMAEKKSEAKPALPDASEAFQEETVNQQQTTAARDEAGPATTSDSVANDQIPEGIPQRFLAATREVPEDSHLVYRPALLGVGELHFVRAMYELDHWEERSVLVPAEAEFTDSPWDRGVVLEPHQLVLQDSVDPHGEFAGLPKSLSDAKAFSRWEKDLVNYFYQSQRLKIWSCPELKEFSRAGESERGFRIRLAQLAQEKRDQQVEKIRDRYRSKMSSLNNQIRRAQQTLDREESQYDQRKVDTVVSVGSSILGALFGRKLFSRTNVNKASSSAKSISRTARERSDVKRAEEKLLLLKRKLSELELQVAQDVAEIDRKLRSDAIELEQLQVKSRKSHNRVEPVVVAWLPWFVSAADEATAGFGPWEQGGQLT